MSPNYHQITFVVEQMLRKKDDKKPLGTRWITRFRERYLQLKTGRTQAMDIKRLLVLDIDIVERFFEQISVLQNEFDIPNWEIYNMDEKGFQMGQTVSDYVVFDKFSGPPVAPETGVSKWVSIIECMSYRVVLKPYIIHIGKEPESGWFLPTNELPDWIWAFSPKGWTDNELAVDWLRRIFNPETSPNEKKHRILILDGHKSHISGEFQ